MSKASRNSKRWFSPIEMCTCIGFLPVREFFDKLKELAIEGHKPAHRPQCSPGLFRFARIEDNTQSRFRAALQHVLALFVETGDDCIVLLEGHEQRGQRNRVINATFPEARIRGKPDA